LAAVFYPKNLAIVRRILLCSTQAGCCHLSRPPPARTPMNIRVWGVSNAATNHAVGS